jgi:hypothetical protein
MVNITDPIYGLFVFAVQIIMVILLLVIFGPKRLTRKRAFEDVISQD